jgi:hypothetical protein
MCRQGSVAFQEHDSTFKLKLNAHVQQLFTCSSRISGIECRPTKYGINISEIEIAKSPWNSPG